MKTLLILIIILFASCSSDENSTNISKGEVEEKLNKNLTELHDAIVVYAEELTKTGDSTKAFIALNNWLVNNENVAGGVYHNTEFLEIEFKNGLKSSISIIPVNEQGEHLTRGGGNGNKLLGFPSSLLETKKIKNKKVLVLIPYPDEFSYYSSGIKDLETIIEQEPLELEADIEVGSDVALSDLDRLGEYGLIILDVHGLKYGFVLSYIEKKFKSTDIWFPDEIISEAFNIHSIPPDKIANGEIEIGIHVWKSKKGEVSFKFSVFITEDYIRQLNIDLKDAIVFGNHCYSGHTADGPNKYNMPEAWKSKGVATYYGYADADNYSAPIDNNFCKTMETELIKGLVKENDSTGAAHLKFDDSEYFYIQSKGYPRKHAVMTLITGPPEPDVLRPLYFNQYFEKDYIYENCDSEMIDKRDGNKYKTVCIGNQTWMAENLRYNGAGICFDNDPKYCKEKGRLYSVFELLNRNVSDENNTVRGLCPEGWHVPSNEEYNELIEYSGGTNNAIIKLRSKDWPPNPTPTDEFGFNLIPTESAFYLKSEDEIKFFSSKKPQTLLWTSSGTIRSDGTDSYNLFETRSTNVMKITGTGQSKESEQYYPCRCIKDKKE